jgi:plasmid stabilization system protein ParE
MSERNAAKSLEWLPGARAAFLETLEYVSRDDEHSARLIAQRVEKSLAAIQAMPLLGRLIGQD